MNIIKFTANEQTDLINIEKHLDKCFDLYEFSYDELKREGEIRLSINILPEGCFLGCSWLETVELKEGFDNAAGGIFADCFNLKSISFPNSMKSIPEGCCDGCESLTSIKFGSDVINTLLNKFFYSDEIIEKNNLYEEIPPRNINLNYII